MREEHPLLRPDLERLMAHRLELERSTQAPATRRNYASDWRAFESWCLRIGQGSLPAAPEAVVLYLTDMLRRGRKITSARRHQSAINDRHRTAGLPAPAREQVRVLLEGAQRYRGEQPAGKAPLEIADLRRICAKLGNSRPRAIRDRAVITLGFTSALRRINLVQLDLADLRFRTEGLTVYVRREKQDQKAEGRLIGVPYARDAEICAVRAIERWLEIRGGEAGPVFTPIREGRGLIQRLSGSTICLIVKRAVAGIGLRAADFGGHSMRSGFVTLAMNHGVREFLIADQTGHRSLSSLRRYFRKRDPFRANACVDLGL